MIWCRIQRGGAMSKIDSTLGSRNKIRIAAEFAPEAQKRRCRAALLGSSALAGGTLRGLALATGMVVAFGASPAFAQCYSTMTGLAGDCTAVVPTGTNATAIGLNANA